MEHLRPEELARLVDEEAGPEERRHLEVCDPCSAELAALKEQTEVLAGLVDPRPPVGLRSSIERELERDRRTAAPRARQLELLQVAAGLALFLLGGLTGAVFVSMGDAESDRPAMAERATTVEEAATTLRSAEAEYLRAVARYAELAEWGGTDPLQRLVALEGIMVTTEAALREAPADPVINNFHLTAVAQREALLRSLELATSDEEWF